MKMELSIKDDNEIRNLIKDEIRGSVKSIGREEMVTIVHSVYGELIEKAQPDKEKVQKIIEKEFKKCIRDVIHSKQEGTINWIKEEARRQIKKKIIALIRCGNIEL